MPSLAQKLAAEFFGTFWLVLGGCGSAVFAAVVMTSGAAPVQIGIGLVGVSLAFGLTVLTMAFAVGHISGGHFNPAVTAGLTAAGKFSAAHVIPYWVAQTLGAIVAAYVLLTIASGTGSFSIANSPGAFATNGYGALSPRGYSLQAAALTEFLMTFFFLVIILGATSKRAPAGFAPIAIGLGLTLIHLISIPITNTSVNPARSTGVALVHLPALAQLWMFWVMPIAGGVVAGLFSRWLQSTDGE